jgi:hypothetical protein
MLHVKQWLSPHAHLVQDSSMEAVHVIPVFNIEEEDDHHPKPICCNFNLGLATKARA